MKLALFLIGGGLAFSQCTVMVQPFPLAATQRIFANGREAGLWKMVISNKNSTDCTVSRQEVELLAPAITFFGNDVGLDLLVRKANLSKWALFARYGKLALALAPAGLAAYGAVSGANGWTIAGAGMSVFQYVDGRAQADAPNPSKYTSQFCTDQFKLASGAGMECFMVAGLTHNAAPVGPVVLKAQLSTAPASWELAMNWQALHELRFF